MSLLIIMLKDNMMETTRYNKIMAFSILLMIIFIFNANRTQAEENKQARIMLATTTFGNAAKEKITIDKIEAALYFACNLTDKFELIPPKNVDSLIQVFKASHEKLTQEIFVKKLKADKIYFVHTDLLANMIRLEISSLDPNSNTKSIGTGYANIHYFNEKTNEPVYDPSILEALQRAMAVAEKDSSMFYGADSLFYIKPVPTLVISGINFINNPLLEAWDLFEQKEVKSYFILESIFEASIKSDKYVCYDIASRDSIYRLFNLAIPENFRSTNDVELSCLENLKVNYFISGEFIRNNNGAELSLYLMEIKNKIARLIKKVNASVNEDKLTLLKEQTQILTNELLETPEKGK
jgi:hypothetical protein